MRPAALPLLDWPVVAFQHGLHTLPGCTPPGATFHFFREITIFLLPAPADDVSAAFFDAVIGGTGKKNKI